MVEDHLARGVEVDLGAFGHPRERLLVEAVEGRMGAEELGYVVHLTRPGGVEMLAIMATQASMDRAT